MLWHDHALEPSVLEANIFQNFPNYESTFCFRSVLFFPIQAGKILPGSNTTSPLTTVSTRPYLFCLSSWSCQKTSLQNMTPVSSSQLFCGFLLALFSGRLSPPVAASPTMRYGLPPLKPNPGAICQKTLAQLFSLHSSTSLIYHNCLIHIGIWFGGWAWR